MLQYSFDAVPESEELPVEVTSEDSDELEKFDEVEEDLDLCRFFLGLLSLSAGCEQGLALFCI